MFLALGAATCLIVAYSALADEIGTTRDPAETAQIGTDDAAAQSTGEPSVDHRPTPHVRKDSGVEFRRNDHPVGTRSGRSSPGSSDSSSDSSGGGGSSGG
jgi:organic hydroperoxide reductase OsmC/OhrA